MSTLAAAPTTNPVLDLITGHWVVFALIIIASIFLLRVSDLLLLRRGKPSLEQRLPRQITMLVLTLLAVIVVVLAIPDEESVGGISDEARSSLLSLIGLGVTALITLSSTTLAANAMSGIMLRATAPIRGGDWIRVGEHFGRVTERGLFHTEIQTEDRDLLSLPNLYLATNPVRIVYGKGTIISAEVALGYGVGRHRIEPLLLEAAEHAGLEEPFVWIMDLKDHVVVYRIAGMLANVKGLMRDGRTPPRWRDRAAPR
jgi:small conductance mechanosensitive channel